MKKTPKKLLEPASVVHARYPCVGTTTLLPDSTSSWYLHQLPNGRVGACVWLYESDDRRLRTVIVRELNNPQSDVFVKTNVRLGSQASHVTNGFLDQIAALPPKEQAA